MTFLALLPVGLSILVLAAHFYRAGNVLLFIAALFLLALTAIAKPWAARALQALLVGAAEWLRTTVFLVFARRAEGRPWLRLAVILTGVAIVSALSAIAFRTKALRARYGLGR